MLGMGGGDTIPGYIVVGEKVALGPLRRDLAATYARWENQLAGSSHGLGVLGIATPESPEEWVEENIKAGTQREPRGVEFTIYDRSDDTPVGTARIVRYSSRARPGHFRHRDR